MIINDEIYPNIVNKISDERLFDSVNLILSLQNDDGGWATYENTRGWRWYNILKIVIQ